MPPVFLPPHPLYDAAEAAGRIARVIPFDHFPRSAPVIQPTLDTGTQALVAGARAWLAA